MTVTCRVDRLSSYLDGELSGREVRELERHMEGCESCRRELEGLKRVISRLRRLERESPPPSVALSLERSVSRELGREGPADRFRRVSRLPGLESTLLPWFALVVALVAVLLLFAQAVERSRTDSFRIVAAGQEQDEESVAEGGEGGPPLRFVAGRELRYQRGMWIEKGARTGPPAETILVDGVVTDPRLRDLPELEELRRLEAPVRLMLEGRLVELRFRR